MSIVAIAGWAGGHLNLSDVLPCRVDDMLARLRRRWPRKMTLGGHVPSQVALRLLQREDSKWQYVTVRNCHYLNSIVEQDYRAVASVGSRKCNSLRLFHVLPIHRNRRRYGTTLRETTTWRGN